MDYQQKFLAIRALAGTEVAIRARRYSDWFVSVPGVEIGGDGLLSSPTATGETPEAAIEKTWDLLTNLKPFRYLVIRAMTDDRRHVKWNGFMWEEQKP